MPKCHYINRVRIQSYSGPQFLAFGLNKKKYFVSLRIQSKCGKIRTRITPNTDTFYAVCSTYLGLLLCMETTKNIINSSKASPGFLTMQWEIGAPNSLIKTTSISYDSLRVGCLNTLSFLLEDINGSRYSRMDLVKFMEDSL